MTRINSETHPLHVRGAVTWQASLNRTHRDTLVRACLIARTPTHNHLPSSHPTCTRRERTCRFFVVKIPKRLNVTSGPFAWLMFLPRDSDQGRVFTPSMSMHVCRSASVKIRTRLLTPERRHPCCSATFFQAFTVASRQGPYFIMTPRNRKAGSCKIKHEDSPTTRFTKSACLELNKEFKNGPRSQN